MFSGCTLLPDSKETRFGGSDQEACQSEDKNIRNILVPYRSLKCVSTAISSGVDTSEVPGCHFL